MNGVKNYFQGYLVVWRNGTLLSTQNAITWGLILIGTCRDGMSFRAEINVL